jgi:hypothetical protein
VVGDSRLNDVLLGPAEDGRAERQRVQAGLLAATDGIDASRLAPEERRALALNASWESVRVSVDDGHVDS